jgi:hypothetical protein
VLWNKGNAHFSTVTGCNVVLDFVLRLWSCGGVTFRFAYLLQKSMQSYSIVPWYLHLDLSKHAVSYAQCQ